MTFIHDDQVKKVGRILLIETRAAFVFCERLVDREINLAAFDRVPVFNLRTCVAELSKDFVLRIVD